MQDCVHKFNTTNSLDTRLHQVSSLSVESELVNELLVMRDFSLLRLSKSGLLLVFLIFSLFVGVEVTSVVMKLLSLELNNFINNLIEEIPCVRNDKDSDI